jgi:hypothetical protein
MEVLVAVGDFIEFVVFCLLSPLVVLLLLVLVALLELNMPAILHLLPMVAMVDLRHSMPLHVEHQEVRAASEFNQIL